MASAVLHDRLACTYCRRRKVRCDRAFPTCERCRFHRLQCDYPKRQPRSTRSRSELSVRSQPVPVRAPAYGEDQCLPHAGGTDRHVPARHTSRSRLSVRAHTISGRGEEAPSVLDVTSILSSAVDKVQQLRKKHRFGVRALTLESVSIPPHVAKQLIAHFFTNIDGKLLPALVDRKLIDVMPDLMDMDHVHFDACILMIYYCILWQGLFFHKANSPSSIDRHYARQVFICCKRTIPIWQQEATGTVTDFIAAMYMVLYPCHSLGSLFC
ncbi:hypothetical protein BJY01DRAFT_214973 [Aspergillus pseudoustus]|uniref:Zn(2)-C6 fungal-type domain-containing protein n=1 Tax=Aspergillus pseudoustus TaxID=1810923 RepID=A0ABR4JWD0_9EURO